ncbi:murein DD-endopeptidase MepM/ murein hydrolase activator NlpD [Microbacterium sp. W4I4]|uniref:M23 family metallopeptidase n=1 Tax=Microbacterium sp. W4I4 TaxID=3042295 RepID=UPI0027888B0C|nr:M23 family metallopeptidase [Microbacterium sp. W4I4]MDQ0614149.1 murein DD-endopeptidase MepM/ murein hydrolase activator NlpD [Microbacterium sp. W4I4]
MNDHLKADAIASDDCGCAPSPDEQRAFWPSSKVTRRGAFAVGAMSALGLTAFGISAGAQVAHAADYPSWDDVKRAKANEAAKGTEITRIQNLIASLTQRAAAAEAAARKAGDEYYVAQQAYFEAADKADLRQEQADEQAKIADESSRQAGQVATQLYRNGGDQAALEVFLSGSSQGADDLLSRLGSMDQLLEYSSTVAEKASAARDSAQSLSDQAKRARDERDRLQKVAEEKMVQAQAAADAAQAALDEKQNNLTTLQAQLAALKDTTAATVAGYEEGERKRKAEEERRRKAEEERRRREAEEAAKNHNSGGGGGGGGTGGSGSGAWRRPHGGRISSGYGSRPPVFSNGVWRSTFHRGLDFANGCGAAIYAAHSGRVDAAFYNGGYGNYIRIQHGGGVATGYGHIARYAVSHGQQVSAGQVIAYAGNTGASQGCHLHFEVYLNGSTTNPYTFLQARGAL